MYTHQFSSVAQSCPTLCDPMNRSTPGLPVHHQLPEFTQTHVHRVGDAIQPSHPLSCPSPPAPNPSQHQSFPMSQLFAWGGHIYTFMFISCMCMCVFSHSVGSDSATLWTVACQATLSLESSRQEYWSGLPFPTPGDLSEPGFKPGSPVSPALAGAFFTSEPPGEPHI